MFTFFKRKSDYKIERVWMLFTEVEELKSQSYQ